MSRDTWPVGGNSGRIGNQWRLFLKSHCPVRSRGASWCNMPKDSLLDSKLSDTVLPAANEEHQNRSESTPASVLVVDDEDRVREGYRRVLTGAGIGTIAVPNAELALELLRNGDLFDVIVSDILMPGMDGTALLREIRKYNLDVPVILVTGNPSLLSSMAAVQFGAFRYLLKPVPTNNLIKDVRDAIQLIDWRGSNANQSRCYLVSVRNWATEQVLKRTSRWPSRGCGSRFNRLSGGEIGSF